jgi:hypothetical protein
LFVTVLGEPKGKTVTVRELASAAGARGNPSFTVIELLGSGKPLEWSKVDSGVRVTLPESLPGQYAYVLKVPGYASHRR